MTRLFKGLSQLHGHSDDDDVGVDDDGDLDEDDDDDDDVAKCAGKAISIIMRSNTSERPTRGQLIEMMMTAKTTMIIYS